MKMVSRITGEALIQALEKGDKMLEEFLDPPLPMDEWNNQEKMLLAVAVFDCHSKWSDVNTIMVRDCSCLGLKRPGDWYTPYACKSQFERMVETELPAELRNSSNSEICRYLYSLTKERALHEMKAAMIVPSTYYQSNHRNYHRLKTENLSEEALDAMEKRLEAEFALDLAIRDAEAAELKEREKMRATALERLEELKALKAKVDKDVWRRTFFGIVDNPPTPVAAPDIAQRPPFDPTSPPPPPPLSVPHALDRIYEMVLKPAVRAKSPVVHEHEEPAVIVSEEPALIVTEEPAVIVNTEPAVVVTEEPAVVVTEEPPVETEECVPMEIVSAEQGDEKEQEEEEKEEYESKSEEVEEIVLADQDGGDIVKEVAAEGTAMAVAEEEREIEQEPGPAGEVEEESLPEEAEPVTVAEIVAEEPAIEKEALLETVDEAVAASEAEFIPEVGKAVGDADVLEEEPSSAADETVDMVEVDEGKPSASPLVEEEPAPEGTGAEELSEEVDEHVEPKPDEEVEEPEAVVLPAEEEKGGGGGGEEEEEAAATAVAIEEKSAEAEDTTRPEEAEEFFDATDEEQVSRDFEESVGGLVSEMEPPDEPQADSPEFSRQPDVPATESEESQPLSDVQPLIPVDEPLALEQDNVPPVEDMDELVPIRDPYELPDDDDVVDVHLEPRFVGRKRRRMGAAAATASSGGEDVADDDDEVGGGGAGASFPEDEDEPLPVLMAPTPRTYAMRNLEDSPLLAPPLSGNEDDAAADGTAASVASSSSSSSVQPQSAARRRRTRNSMGASENEADASAVPSLTGGSRPVSPAASSTTSSCMSDDRERQRVRKSLCLLYDQIAEHRYASHFLHPIKESEAPDYYDFIKKPVDLTGIKRKIDNGQVRSLGDFEAQIYLMFSNAFMYNGGDDVIFERAREMYRSSLEAIERHREYIEPSTSSLLSSSKGAERGAAVAAGASDQQQRSGSSGPSTPAGRTTRRRGTSNTSASGTKEKSSGRR